MGLSSRIARPGPKPISSTRSPIRLYQDTGFTVAEIARLISATSGDRRAWGRLAERKVAELDARIPDAERAKQLITHALSCPHGDLLDCLNFRAALDAQLGLGRTRDSRRLHGDAPRRRRQPASLP